MKKLSIIILALFCIAWQGKAQSCFNVYQGETVLKSIPTSEVDSIAVSETVPHIVTFWQNGSVLQSYYTDEVDSITVVNDADPWSYMGIVGFNSELYKKDLGILAKSTAGNFKSFVNSLTRKDGTLLYYAVDNAIDMIDDEDIVTPLRSINLVTFTDGLDQGSIMMNSNYSSSKEYLEAMSQIVRRGSYYGLPVNAYAVGLRGNDVSDVTTFRDNLALLASSSDKSFEVSSVSELQTMFQDIANQIISVNTRQTMSLRIPGIDTGTRIRFVFDGQSAESSELYIEGTFNLSDRTFRNVTYHGMKSRSGKVVQGTQDGIFVTFTFLGLQREEAGQTVPTTVRHYYMLPSSSTWQLNSEFTPDNNTQRTVSHSGTVVVLVLDCSSSLGSDFAKVQTYANTFIDMIANNAMQLEVTAPTNVTAEWDDNSQLVFVSWDAVRHAEYYQVYRSSSESGTYTLVADNITSTSWIDTAPLGKNYYRIKAIGHGLTSEYSNTAMTKTVYKPSGYVDLGLPSGTLWATCNVGANSPEDYGDYFAWGETEPKDTYNWSTYKWCNGNYDKLTKYCGDSSYGTVDNKTELDLEDDAAYVNWGPAWRMPSYDQFAELINSSYTTTTWTTQNGVYGRLITSKSNGNSIFLPAAGCRGGASLGSAGSSGYYWSRTLRTSYPNNARYLRFGSSYIYSDYSVRYYGLSVRPVRLSE